ncbi:MAG TPA: hypothetical protein VK034_08415 [Enhygromyxa sp.]|nr:hypothetical protein [Enhygromyxa sp.]
MSATSEPSLCSAWGPAEAEVAVPKIEPPARRPSFDQRAPSVGDSAPPIALATLTGDQVALPMSGADRAAVLIFGSFS